MFIRRKSSKLRLLKFFLIFTLILILAVAAYMIINSPLFTIKEIDIEKHDISEASLRVNCATDLEVRQASFTPGQNFLFLDTDKVVENLKNKFICIQNVVVEKEFPNKIKLNISGREAKVLLISLSYKEATTSSNLENIATPSAQDYSDIFFADDEGVIFSRGDSNINLPKIFIYEKAINLGKDIEDLIIKVVKVFDKMIIFGIDTKSAKIISDEILLTDTTPKIIFKLNGEIDIQLASLQLILQQAKIDANTLEFIDLRFDKPVVRFAPKKK